jgi:CheY-like chemotaxis protein
VSLKVLLADDNMTAQRLGSKILTDAGIQVVTVSNGAAAVKKIASEKPDVLILDVYMPGYTGLEVCEKVKNDPATAQVPVILTVTNMEPYNQSDGYRVRADGVMIKPFEATDLLAVVQKFGAKAAKAKPEPQTVKMAALDEFKDATYEEWKSEAAEEQEAPKLEVSQEMAAAPALGFDEMAAEPAPSFSVDAPSFSSEAEPVSAHGLADPIFAADQPSAPSLQVEVVSGSPMPWSQDDSPTASLEMPVSLDEPPAISAPAELEYTSAAQVGELHVEQAAELEVTAVSTPDVVIAQDSALVTDPDELSQFATSVGVEHPEDIVVGVAMPGLTGTPDEAPPAAYDTTIKMQAYSEPAPEAIAEAAPEVAPASEEPAVVETDMRNAFSVNGSGAAAAPALEPESALVPSESEIPDHLVAQFAAELDQAHQEREAMGLNDAPAHEDGPVTESIMAVAEEVPASQLDEEKIAAAVNRALEKYKDGLRAELIATIVRELKG